MLLFPPLNCLLTCLKCNVPIVTLSGVNQPFQTNTLSHPLHGVTETTNVKFANAVHESNLFVFPISVALKVGDEDCLITFSAFYHCNLLINPKGFVELV